MPWRYVQFRDNRVLARCDDSGELQVDGGRVEIRYRPTDARAYRAGARNLRPAADTTVHPDDFCAEAAPDGDQGASKGKSKAKGTDGGKGGVPSADLPANAIIAYTDGACSGNPGPCGLGVVLLDDGRQRELSEYLGHGTNNVGELAAIGAAAEAVPPGARPLRIHTDSKYSIGVLSLGWKAKKNQELILRIKGALAKHEDWGLIYVPGHAGVPLNERADELAVAAVQNRASTAWKDT